jgi:hypothetical protein
MNEEVTLTRDEWRYAAQIGLDRVISSRCMGLEHRNGMDEADAYRNNIEGACGERAAAKYLGVYWDGSVDTFRSKADLLGNVEVKTRTEHWHDLIVRRWDAETPKLYIHVTGLAPTYRIRGWLWLGSPDDCRDEWKQTHGGRPEAWFIPTSQLSQDWGEFLRMATPATV